MDGSILERFKEQFRSVWSNILNRFGRDSTAQGMNKEKFVVLFVAIVLAFCLWLLVNLSRDFNLKVNLPINLGNIPEDRALVEELPEFVTVSIQGEGWKLINFYNNPPTIFVDVSSVSGQVNLLDQVQQQMNAIPDINVQKVEPLSLSLDLEERVSRKVPVVSNVNVRFEEQFDFVGSPTISPDSINILGASSLVEQINSWETDSVMLRGVREDISTDVSLREASELITLSSPQVIYQANVSEYTEGSHRVNVRTRNLPEGRNITYSPSTVTVVYKVPIEEYREVSNLNPFQVYVPYRVIENDSSGFVEPSIEVNDEQFHIKIQGQQPPKVAYFLVVDS